MKTHLLNRFLLAGLLIMSVASARAGEEQDLIATLQSSTNAPQTCAACERLRVIGTAESVPALTALLLQERTAQAARYALEGMPCPEAVAALRETLGKASGPIKVGLIDSLGWRHDAAAAPLLAPLLADADATIASAAASALGRIGGEQAVAALAAAREKAAPEVLPAVLDGSLRCADLLLSGGDTNGAITVYRSLSVPTVPDHIRVAAWRGLVIADAGERATLVTAALTGQDRPLNVVALKVVRELNDKAVIEACVGQWAALPVDAAVAVLEAHLKLGSEALPTVKLASQSPQLPVRIAAWQALGRLEDASSIPALAKAAARGEPAERASAREGLASMPGAGMHDALLKALDSAENPEKAELLRALGDRSDRAATDALLRNAASESEPVRLAALGSLKKVAVPDTLLPLLDLAAKSKSEDECEPVLQALGAVCQASADKDKAAQTVLDAIGRLPDGERRMVLPVLPILGTPAALETAQAAARSQDPEVVKQAVQALSQWPNAAAATNLLEVARATSDPSLHSLALHGCIGVAEQEPDATKRLAILQQALAIAKRPEEQKQALGQIGQIATPSALEAAMGYLTNSSLSDEAGLATVMIAEKLGGSDLQLAHDAAAKVLAQCKTPAIVKRALVIRARGAGAGPFIQSWLVSGPYRKAGANGALALFDVIFPPELAGKTIQWMALPRGDMADLATAFPNQENCVAYLKARVIAPAACDAVLLLGSDDGVKVWLNGAVVHANNVDRGAKPDEDVAPIQLKKGANDLLLKITQGGGGWGAYARIVGPEGLPIAGLSVEPPAANTPAAKQPSPKQPSPKAAKLPKRDAFQKTRLSEEFYAEGVCCADINRDGKLDVVAGPFWYEGSDLQKRHEYRPAKAFDPKGYSDDFLTYVGDFNGDGWPDILCVGFPGKEACWYENPAGKEGEWKRHLAFSSVANESPAWGDLYGDGHSELIFASDGCVGYAAPDPARPDQPWVFHAISDKNPKRTGHGIGFGDINGDKRMDIVESIGWWEQPAGAKPDQRWIFHPQQFAEAGAQMLVYDVDGDGLADVITTWHCHQYGLLWWQQVKTADGEPGWKKHVILSPTPKLESSNFRVSQMHALELVDINGDGLKDIITGKRFWAHGPNGDKEPAAPAVLFWLELQREGPGKARFVPHLIDDDGGVGTQIAAADLNNDGRQEVIVANKKGISVYWNQRPK